MPHKIAVTGSVDGKLSEFFAKLNALQAKQNFAFTVVTGNLFANLEEASGSDAEEISKLINGEIEVSLTTYFATGRHPLPEQVVKKLESSDGELCPNLIALGRKGRVKTAEGFNIVTIGGSQHQGDEPMNPYAALYSEKDVSTAKGYNDADILVTSDWPAAIRTGSKEAFDATEPPKSKALAELCTALKPRYHFSTSDVFFEREPFFHQGDAPRPITRFLSLAPFGNPTRSKWIYAFSLEPSAGPPQHLPEDTTAPPFTSPKKRKLDSQQDTYNAMRFSNGQSDSYRPRGGGNKRRKGAAGPPPTPSECYFCLSNKQFESHMLGSIGTAAYLATAKGPLPLRDTFPSLGFPGHMLIILVEHVPTLAAVPAHTRRETEGEMQKYRDALHQMVSTKSKNGEDRATLGAVTWEISRAGGVHDHWQFLPVPVDMITKGLVEAGFKVEAENAAYPTQFATTPTDIASAEGGDYFRVMIWSEGTRKEMVLPLDQTFRFDLQFGRRVMGKLLGLEKRTHWKDCGQSRVEEEADCDKFKEVFQPFDFTV